MVIVATNDKYKANTGSDINDFRLILSLRYKTNTISPTKTATKNQTATDCSVTLDIAILK